MFGRRTRREEKKEIDPRTPSAVTIQCAFRVAIAKMRIKSQAKRVWQRVYDPKYRRFFWFNKWTKKSRWDQPKFTQLFYEEDREAAVKIERLVRGFIGRMRVRKVANMKYTRFYDASVNKFYWLDKSTGKTTWNVSPWLFKLKIEMPTEDRMLYESYQKIKELEAKLREKDQEIKEVRKKRFEELEPEVIRDKVQDVRHLQRSKNMDEWKVEELAAWFTEMKMEEYVPFLFRNRVDGLLFINLTDDEWEDMGIQNQFHCRKLKLILKAYRTRYQWRKEKAEVSADDDDLLSEYSPSELSELLAKEDASNDYYSEDDEEEDDDSYASEDEELMQQSAEQRLQKKIDMQNITIKLRVKGDGVSFPMIGDIVRVRYVTTLTDTGKVVMSTKHVLGRPWVEFVLGIDQIIKGVDRALPLMCIGERSHVTVSPEYSYGAEGLPPLIPPNASLTFDITLLGFRPRSLWVKPLIQDNSTKEKPYLEDLKVYMKMVDAGDLKNLGEDDEDGPLKGMVSSGGGKGVGSIVTGSGSAKQPKQDSKPGARTSGVFK